MIVNVYDKLGIPFTATPEQIQRALRRAAQNQLLEPNKLRQCRDWLLNPDTRAKYDARLLAERPNLVQTPPKMVNIYAKLGLEVSATNAQIQLALRQAAQTQSISPANLQKCEAILLTPSKRAQYNEKLMAIYPELFSQPESQRARAWRMPLLDTKNWRKHVGVFGSVLLIEMLVALFVAVPIFNLTIYMILLMIYGMGQ